MLEPLRLADMLVFDATYRRVNIQYHPSLENSCADRPEFFYKHSQLSNGCRWSPK